ncbi:MAG: hypothetical protein WC236_13615 [Gallionellaceae bacterium]
MKSLMQITLAGIVIPLAAWILTGLIFLLFQCEGGGVGANPRCYFVPTSIANLIGNYYFLSMVAASIITPISTVAYLLLNVVWWFIKPRKPS